MLRPSGPSISTAKRIGESAHGERPRLARRGRASRNTQRPTKASVGLAALPFPSLPQEAPVVQAPVAPAPVAQPVAAPDPVGAEPVGRDPEPAVCGRDAQPDDPAGDCADPVRVAGDLAGLGWVGQPPGVAAGQLYLLARLLLKLHVLASETSLFQTSLAHAAYTAAPEPVWPESPAAESIWLGRPEREPRRHGETET